jgi:serine/threonine-protein kinase
LKEAMRSLGLETGVLPGEASAVLTERSPEGRARGGVLSQLVDRFRPDRAGAAPEGSIAILPFRDLDDPGGPGLQGFALSGSVAARLARVAGLVVRPLSAYRSLADQLQDPQRTGQDLHARLVLWGSFTRDAGGLRLTWQLLDVASRALRSGGTISLASSELADLHERVPDEVLSVLRATGALGEPARPSHDRTTLDDLPPDVREEVLTARALLAAFALRAGTRSDLERAGRAYERVLERAPTFAPAHAGLGTAYLRSARNGFGGVEHLRLAERHLVRALELDPDLVEARLYRASTMIWAGEKERARLELQDLLGRAPSDPDVLLAAAVVLQLDGLLDEALRLQGAALRAAPALAPRAHYYRGRILLFQGGWDASRQEIEKGLAIEPGHTLLRHVLGFLQLLRGELDEAVATLEGVLADAPDLRIVYPTLAIGYLRSGREAEAHALITDELLDAAGADAETAYRVATWHAVRLDVAGALEWLRRSVYLGNENVPWFRANPAWESLRDEPGVHEILGDLDKVRRVNRVRWEPVLAELPS